MRSSSQVIKFTETVQEIELKQIQPEMEKLFSSAVEKIQKRVQDEYPEAIIKAVRGDSGVGLNFEVRLHISFKNGECKIE
jgi:hypothetical protein